MRSNWRSSKKKIEKFGWIKSTVVVFLKKTELVGLCAKMR